MIYHFETLGSTNDEAQGAQYRSGDIVVAERQSAGRGQRGHSWISGEGINLTLSAVLQPTQIEARDQFRVSQVAALSICDMLRGYELSPTVKWTNDIYIDERKIVGILIENRLSGTRLARSVVGIGLNVNQEIFDPSLPNPTSMSLVAGATFDRQEVLQALERAIMHRFDQLERGDYSTIEEEYHTLMYRRGEEHTYRLSSGEERRGTILGVESSGHLIVEWGKDAIDRYSFGEIEFVISERKR